jgi:hypothetical protein
LELSETHRDGWGRRHVNVVYLSVITLVTIAAAALRAVRLDHPVRYDEAFSYLAYATGQGPSVWLAYTYPNNRLFHTLLVCFSTALGGPGLAAIRAPAFSAAVVGLFTIPIMLYPIGLRSAIIASQSIKRRESWIHPDKPNITRGFVVVAYGQTLEEVIAAYPNLGARIHTIRRRLRYPSAEV